MKFIEAYEAIISGHDLVFDGEQRVSIGDKRPDRFFVFLEDGGTQGLDWLHLAASQCELAPRKLPALPDGYRWDERGGNAQAVIGAGGYRISALAGPASAADAKRQAKAYEDNAAVLRALVKEFETR